MWKQTLSLPLQPDTEFEERELRLTTPDADVALPLLIGSASNTGRFPPT